MDTKSIVNLAQTQRALTAAMLATNVNKCMAVENTELQAENAKLRKLVASMATGLEHIFQATEVEDMDESYVGAIAREMLWHLDWRFDNSEMGLFVDPLTHGQINDIVRRRTTVPPVNLNPSTELESEIVESFLERIQ
jgi:hypothetical protein